MKYLAILALLSAFLARPASAADVYLTRCDSSKPVTLNRGDVLHVQLPGIGWKTATANAAQMRPLCGVAPLCGMRFEAVGKGCGELRLEKVRGCCRGTSRSFTVKVEVK